MKKMVVPPAALLTYLYFLQGLPYGLQARFLPIYFRAHGMSLTNISYIKALFFPWLCKTLWAPLVDRHGNKKTWLLWSMLGLCITCVAAAGIEPSWMVALCGVLFVFNLLTSTQDIATDGLAIEILTSSQVASGNVGQVVGYKLGAIIGGGLLAWLSDHISWSAIFVLLAVIYLSAVALVHRCVTSESKHKHMFDYTLQVPQPNDFHPSSDLQTNSKYVKTLSSPSAVPHITDGNKTHKLNSDCAKSKLSCYSSANKCLEQSSTHFGWLAGHFAQVLHAEGTAWILAYVLVYKLGEQGALNMMPMYLMDHGMPVSDVGLWTGVVGQGISIAGSVLGGLVISSLQVTALRVLWMLSVVKVAVLGCEWIAVYTWQDQHGTFTFSTAPCVALMLTLLLLSGAVSTAAFTLMMHCSQRADPRCRASHYSLLATAEVLGKLLFSVFVGAITDSVGYPNAFALFLTLGLVVLPLFWHAPPSLGRESEGGSGGWGVESGKKS